MKTYPLITQHAIKTCRKV